MQRLGSGDPNYIDPGTKGMEVPPPSGMGDAVQAAMNALPTGGVPSLSSQPAFWYDVVNHEAFKGGGMTFRSCLYAITQRTSPLHAKRVKCAFL